MAEAITDQALNAMTIYVCKFELEVGPNGPIFCLREFQDISYFRGHVNADHMNNGNTLEYRYFLKCTKCSKEYLQRDFREHVRPMVPRKQYCSCSKRFDSKCLLSSHINLEHGGNNTTCFTCDMNFQNEWALLGHVRKAHEQEFALHESEEQMFSK